MHVCATFSIQKWIIKKIFADKSDYYREEWCSGSNPLLNSSLNHLLPAQKHIPMPTLYANDGNRKSIKPSLTQLVLYNMASVLASVATGYDVRVSNVSPVHPNLQPPNMSNENYENYDNDVMQRHTDPIYNGYGTPQRTTVQHNTYHGPTKHVR